jgi:hypothetical protein
MASQSRWIQSANVQRTSRAAVRGLGRSIEGTRLLSIRGRWLQTAYRSPYKRIQKSALLTFLGDQSPFEKFRIAGRFIIDGFSFDIEDADGF